MTCRRSVGLLLVLPLLVSHASAQSAAAPPAVTPAVRIEPVLYITSLTPPASYRRWYRAAERCLGLRGDVDRVRWYATVHPWTDGRWGLTYAMWQPPHRITLNAEGIGDSTLVTHEAVHDVLSYHAIADTARHPLPYFDGRCARAVYP